MGLYSGAENIRYIYHMQLFKKHKLDIHPIYLYLTAIVFAGILVIQISGTSAVQNMQGVLRYSVLFASNYVIWVLMIGYINGSMHTIGSSSSTRTKVTALISLLLLVLANLVITNIIYYGYLLMSSDLTISGVWIDFKPFVLKSFLSRCLDLIIIIVLIRIINGYLTIQKQKMEVLSLENQLHLSQLETLRYQLDPHFLFNALHMLHSLIGYDDQKAKAIVIKITNLLRRMLHEKGAHFITLEEELDYFSNYLDIEQERFHDRLTIRIEVDHDATSVKVPALMLQPLIENAFKHGISLLDAKGSITLEAKVVAQRLSIKLGNTVPNTQLESVVHSSGIGIGNLKQRLDQLYGKEYSFTVERENGMFIVAILLKLKY